MLFLRLWFIAFLGLSGCLTPDLWDKVTMIGLDTDVSPIDADDDGYDSDVDCDDDNAAINPVATEVCNGLDDNCNEATDEEATDALTFYRDADDDGYGIESDTADACSVPEGYAAEFGDCDDADAEVNPGHEEVCDNFADDNCNGTTDENLDDDGDGWTTCGGDCDDTIGSINPGADEECDGRDNDCDGDVDIDAVDASAWYADVDTDGYGDVTTSTTTCDAPPGYVADATDCDDLNIAVNPSATEVCNGVDDDCDEQVDVDAVDATTWYADLDRDRYGDDDVSVLTCDAPTDYTDAGGDCDDADAGVNPDAAEVCDGTDQNCNGTTDDEGTDGDGDGESSCEGDCDDTDSAVNTGAAEACNGADDDCDGVADDGLSASAFFYDYDLDSYGDPSVSVNVCAAPSGYVSNDDDCDDADATINPAALEICDGVDDENCDGTVDESTASDALTWYADADSDSYGDASVTASACEEPSGYTADATDCNDSDSTIYPTATELCDGIDNDCDSFVPSDEADADADDYAECAGDCDDADANVSPGATEDLDGIDNDCDGDIDDGTEAFDDDGDCYCETAPCTGSVTSSCGAPSGGDCDDDRSGVSPAEAELCDNVDNNCDGSVDEGVTPTWYYDNDGDGYGDNASTSSACSAPSSSYIAVGDDCDDTDENVHPDITEDVASTFACYDQVDNDCDADDSTATGQEWDFGDSDCTSLSTTLDVAVGDNLLSMDTFDSGDVSEWVDVPTGFAQDDVLVIGSDCSDGPEDVGRECYMQITQGYPSGDPRREALCASLTGLNAGNYYQVAYLGIADESSSFTIDRALLNTALADLSEIDVEPTDPAYGDWDFETLATSWAGYETVLLTNDADMTFCFGMDGGDLSFARISIRDVGP